MDTPRLSYRPAAFADGTRTHFDAISEAQAAMGAARPATPEIPTFHFTHKEDAA